MLTGNLSCSPHLLHPAQHCPPSTCFQSQNDWLSLQLHVRSSTKLPVIIATSPQLRLLALTQPVAQIGVFVLAKGYIPLGEKVLPTTYHYGQDYPIKVAAKRRMAAFLGAAMPAIYLPAVVIGQADDEDLFDETVIRSYMLQTAQRQITTTNCSLQGQLACPVLS